MRKILALASSTIAFLSAAAPVLGAEINIEGVKPPPYANLGPLISSVMSLLFFVAGLLSFIFIILGGIQWITAGGDAKAAQSARDRITAAVIGLIVVVAAYAITLILGQVFGIDIFNYKFETAPGS